VKVVEEGDGVEARAVSDGKAVTGREGQRKSDLESRDCDAAMEGWRLQLRLQLRRREGRRRAIPRESKDHEEEVVGGGGGVGC